MSVCVCVAGSLRPWSYPGWQISMSLRRLWCLRLRWVCCLLPGWSSLAQFFQAVCACMHLCCISYASRAADHYVQETAPLSTDRFAALIALLRDRRFTCPPACVHRTPCDLPSTSHPTDACLVLSRLFNLLLLVRHMLLRAATTHAVARSTPSRHARPIHLAPST